ncbi:MAG TPA: DUF4202 family protein [Kofleriaceae bacterium]|nr:DUF4202 family protein [Kofleriaceae bacterium]
MSIAIVHDATAALTAASWRADDFDFWAFDRLLDELAERGEPLRIAGADAAVIDEIALRAQRLAITRNSASRQVWFMRVLAAHVALYDVTRPLVRADLDHALDTWRWTLRLDGGVSAAVQLAALLHDIERLVSESDARVEHLAADYQAFKDAHARAGAGLALDLLARCGVPAAIAGDACALIATHERRDESADVGALNDADALSFFSLSSPGYLAYFGPAQTQRKVDYTLARMSLVARDWLPRVRVPAVVRRDIEAWHEAAGPRGELADLPRQRP